MESIRLLFGLKVDSINYYIQVIVDKHISVRMLEFKIKSNEYERLPEYIKDNLMNHVESTVVDFIKNPILIRNSNQYETISEKVLQKLILEDIEEFMKELGNSLSFVGSEYTIKVGDTYNYIDLFFNIEFYSIFFVVKKIILYYNCYSR